MAAFIINRPILAMLVLGLIALIGFVCIFALPVGRGALLKNESQQFST